MLFPLIIFGLDYQLALNMVNKLREQFGIQPLHISETLNQVATKYANTMASRNTLNHFADGSQFDQRIRASGYKGTSLAENIGEGYRSIVDAIKGWIASPEHFKNLMNPKYSEVGIGMAKGHSGTEYWSQEFGDGQTSSASSNREIRNLPSTYPSQSRRVKWTCPKGYQYSNGKCLKNIVKHSDYY